MTPSGTNTDFPSLPIVYDALTRRKAHPNEERVLGWWQDGQGHDEEEEEEYLYHF